MKFKETIASKKGEQSLWSCIYCGAVICTLGKRGKPHLPCPSCERHEWGKTEAPVAMFEDIE